MDTKTRKQINYWLLSACILIFIMVIIGGITRLTRSGLSMVEWHPISGVIPPITYKEWTIEFEKYKKFPEYNKINKGMTLNQFKFIFFWEYIHRLIARILGVFFVIPFFYFIINKRLNPKLIKKLITMFLLGGIQGLYGWYMVKSGLIDEPSVSHYRLAGHLILAFSLMVYIVWTILNINKNKFEKGNSYNKQYLNPILHWIIFIIFLQITYGAFTAGLKAGYGWNTFPKMAGQWIPNQLFSVTPWYLNFIEDNFTVQFIHRILGWVLCMLIPGFWHYSKSFELTLQQNQAIIILVNVLIGQFLLGMLTLIWVVPIWLGILHQFGALILVIACTYTYFLINNTEKQSTSA